MVNRGEQEKPTHLNFKKRPQFINVLRDKLTAVYGGKGIHNDMGAVQSNLPVPSDCDFYYFEVQVVLANPSGSKLSIGLSCTHSLLNRTIGSDENAVGYQSADGWKLSATSRRGAEPFGPTYGEHDVVGCGIDYVNSSIFFTKNGDYLGTAATPAAEDYYPSACLNLQGNCVRFNFSGPFQYNIEAYIRNNINRHPKSFANDEVSQLKMQEIIKGYLLHRGYAETLKAFEAAIEHQAEEGTPGGSLPAEVKTPKSPDKNDGTHLTKIIGEKVALDERRADEANVNGEFSFAERGRNSGKKRVSSKEESEKGVVEGETVEKTGLKYFNEVYSGAKARKILYNELQSRKELNDSIMGGDILRALSLLDRYYPSLMREDPPVLAASLLLSQHMVELLRGDNPDFEGAVNWMRTTLAPFRDAPEIIQESLSDCCALICYEQPMNCPVKHCFDMSRRSLTANMVNDYILKNVFLIPSMSPLNVLLSHLVACKEAIRKTKGNRGQIPSARLLCLPACKQIEYIVRKHL